MTRRFAVLSIAMLLALPMLAGAQPTPIPPEAARQTPLTPTGNLDPVPPGEKPQPSREQPMGRQSGNNQIHRAQQALKEAGYDPGPTDGHLGPRTRQALRNYQRDHGLPVTGQLNRATRQALLGEKGAAAARSQEQTPATLGRLLTKDRIRIAEKNLQELGFDPGPVDGVSTDQTTAAVRAFQERRGLPVSGLLDDVTQRQLIPGIEQAN